MSWRDNFTAKGRFRDAQFVVRSDDLEFGRRAQVHEYPLRDKPYVEDLGRKARQFTIEVFVVGADYFAARDKLIDAIEKPGPGTLVHPYFGTLRVSIVSARKRESSRTGGMASFTLTCVEGGELQFPTASVDTAVQVDAVADTLTQSAIDDFAEQFSVYAQPHFFLTEVEQELGRTLADVEAVLGNIASSIAAEIRAPANMAAAIVGSVQRIVIAVTEPLRALQIYKGLFDAGSNSPAVPTGTANRQQQARNNAALHALTRRSAICETARTASTISFETRNDALDNRDAILAALDQQMEAIDPVSGEPIGDAVYQELQDLYAAVAGDLNTRGGRLPSLSAYTASATLPAVVLAYNIYGDASKDADLIARNNLRHPGFVPGGFELEVLNG